MLGGGGGGVDPYICGSKRPPRRPDHVDYTFVGGEFLVEKNFFGPNFVFRRLWHQHSFLDKTQGPARKPVSLARVDLRRFVAQDNNIAPTIDPLQPPKWAARNTQSPRAAGHLA